MCHSDRSLAPYPPVRGAVGECRDLTLLAPDGARFGAHLCRPALPTRRGVVILPDVRGLHPFYKDLAQRFAEAGFAAIAIDYFGRTAPTPDRSESFDYRSHIERTTPEAIAFDVRAAVQRLRAELGGVSPSIFTVGFCFGGTASWRQSAEGLGLSGCIGFYGGRPMERAGPWIPRMKAPLLLLLAGNDATPASEFQEFVQKVRQRGVEVEAKTYEGAPHSFFDRTSSEHAEACADAWNRLLNFAERHSSPLPAP